MRVGVIGSCGTRDMWSSMTNPPNLLFFGRTSIASVVAPRIDADLSGLKLSSPWQLHAVRCDVHKMVLEPMERFAPEVLIVDLINERFDLFRVAGSTITYSHEFIKGGGPSLPWARAGRVVDRLSGEAEQLWVAALARLADFIRRSPTLRKARIILHRAPWAGTYCIGDDLSEPQHAIPTGPYIAGGRMVTCAPYSVMTQRLYDRFLAILPEAEQIEVDRRFHVSATVHQWGFGPFHYVKSYYADFRRQALERAGLTFSE